MLEGALGVAGAVLVFVGVGAVTVADAVLVWVRVGAGLSRRALFSTSGDGSRREVLFLF